MLGLLLDENISPVISTQINVRRPEISIQSIFDWRAGALVNQPDHLVLNAATEDGLTLVTFDVHTIRPLTSELYAEGVTHHGVIFVHPRTIRSDDFGPLIRAIEQLWNQEHQAVWINRIHFLREP